jgi:hypothetical protein
MGIDWERISTNPGEISASEYFRCNVDLDLVLFLWRQGGQERGNGFQVERCLQVLVLLLSVFR